MAQTITPVVHGGSRRRWAVSLVLHLLGALASAATLGALLGATGALLGAPWGRGGMLIVALIAIAYAAREITGLPVPILELRRQVPEWWRGSFGKHTSAFLYGLALGPGVGTHLRHGTFIAVAAVALVVGDPLLGVALVTPFGLARALGLAVVSNARTSAAVGNVGERLERVGAGAVPRIANGLALIALAAAALMTSLPSGEPAQWLWPLALAATFAWAAAAKLLRRGAWRQAVRAHALPGWMERVATPAVPAVEVAVVILLLAGRVRAGAALAVLLLAAFSLAIPRARRSEDGLVPCGCFGGRARRSVRWLLTRNAALGLLALGALVAGDAIPLEMPGAGEALPGLLVILGVGLLGAVVRKGAGLWSKQEIGPFETN